MLIGLLTLAYLLFGHGHQTFLLNPNLEKNVSVYVKDKDRKRQIDETIKAAQKSEATFLKKAKDVYEKKLKELNLSRSSTQADFANEYNLFYEDLSSLQAGYVTQEIKIRSYIKPTEWDSIMNKVLAQPDNAKARKQLLEENKKLHDRLLASCNKHITDASGKSKAKALVDGYQAEGDSVAQAFLDLNYRYLKAVRPYQVTPADFEPMQAKMINLRKGYSDYLVKMRFQILALTPDKEWEGMAKEFTDLFTYISPGI